MLMSGEKLTRAGWNGRKLDLAMYVAVQFPDENSANTNPYLYMQVGNERTPWHPSNLDIFADDWQLVE